MAETTGRKPEEIRRDCAGKLRQVEASSLFTAMLSCLLGEHWTKPRIEQLCIRSDGCLVARCEGHAGFDTFLGPAADLVRNIRGIAEVAGLDGDELGYLLGRVASLKGPQ